MQRGGQWADNSSPAPAVSKNAFHYSFPAPDLSPQPPETVCFITYPTIQFFDGRSANRPWLQELPDPLTQITWGNWVEIHPETAQKLNIKDGDLLHLQSPHGTVEAPAYVYHGISPGTVAMPLGQGHTNYGRFADNRSSNPLNVLPGNPDPSSRGIIRALSGVTLKKKEAAVTLAHTDGSRYQFKRELAQSVSAEEYQKACAAGHAAHLRLPLPEGYDPAIDFYPPHQHKDYRWCMVIDLDRCIGCGACVVACYAENNVAVVGREQVIKEREMSWRSLPPHALPALRQRALRISVPGVCPPSQRRRFEQSDLQSLHRHALLLAELPL
jgi:molybdopterin-containing oxidoreductase family iron-sulfur binding subunit